MQDWASDDYIYSSGSTNLMPPPINNEGIFLTNIDNVDRERANAPARGATYNYTPYACNKCSHILPPFMLNESNAAFARTAELAREAAEDAIEKANERAEQKELKKMMENEYNKLRFMFFILIVVIVVLYGKNIFSGSGVVHFPGVVYTSPVAPTSSPPPS